MPKKEKEKEISGNFSSIANIIHQWERSGNHDCCVCVCVCLFIVIVYSLDLIIFSNLGLGFIPPPFLPLKLNSIFYFYFFHFHICCSQLAEALYEYGRGNDKEALQLLGPDFDANNCRVWSSITEQLDQGASKSGQYFHILEFIIWILLLYARWSVHLMNKLMYSMKSGTVCCLILDMLWRVRHKFFCCHQTLLWFCFNCKFLILAIEVIEKQIKKREGVPFLWRLLV